MPQDQPLQGGAIAVLRLFDQLNIRSIALGDLSEGIENDYAPWSAVWANPMYGTTAFPSDTVSGRV
jgi:hypothetical protein